MSEVLKSAEHQPTPELGNIEKDLLAEKIAKAKGSEALDPAEARAAIEKATPLSKEVGGKKTEQEDTQSSDISWWSKELGNQSFDRTLASVRRKLSGSQRRLSKVIHQPAIEKVSDITGKTIARPSGILLGGIFSFVASLGAYLLARHLGGELRYSIFAVTFVAGYAVGIVVEILWRLVRRKKSV